MMRLLLGLTICACVAANPSRAAPVMGGMIASSPAPTASSALALFDQARETSLASLYADQSGDDAATAPTAIYDISAHVVVLPDGSRLEAHSGLGERADDPRFVREHMRGATPPALYGLQPRKGLFHGVAALRLMPILGEVFGRAGLLAHTYMLHGRPESNGCVVFRDYTAFLEAFRDGRIRRLRVRRAVGDMALRGNNA